MGFYNWRLTGHALLFPHTLNVRTYHSAPMFLFQSLRSRRYTTTINSSRIFTTDGSARSIDHSWESVKCLTWLKSVRFFSAFAWWGMLLALPGLWFALRDRECDCRVSPSHWSRSATYAVVWSNAHYAAPVTCVVILLIMQSLRHLRLMKWKAGTGAQSSRALRPAAAG